MDWGIRRLTIAAALAVSFVSSEAAATTYLPSITIGTAALIKPADANTYYTNGTTSTDGLKAYTNVETPTPPEILELARALNYDPDLIYQYVRNNIQTVWMYGLQKGALGAEIDKSGTPFDQAELMVALLRQGPTPFTASYVAGTITPTPAQFQQWTGITNARAACQMLSSGGIPAKINNTTNVACNSFASGDSVTSIEMAHIWVQVTISGSHTAGCSASDVCVFDPSAKVYTWKTGIDLGSAMQFTSGAPLAAALTGYSHGTDTTYHTPWVSNLDTTKDQSGLNPLLQGYASNLLAYLQSNGLQGAQMEDIVGGGVISPDNSTLRQAALPYADPSPPYSPHVWTPVADQARYNAIPDKYRTTLRTIGHVRHYKSSTSYDDVTAFDATFYVDEIYGRRLSVDTDYTEYGIILCGGDTPCDPNSALNWNKITLTLDGQSFTNIPTYKNVPVGYTGTARGLPAHIELIPNHPYAASADGTPTTGGNYMDNSVDKQVVLITPLSIVTGWGDVSASLFTKWSGEVSAQAGLLPKPINPPSCGDAPCVQYYWQHTGAFTREKTDALWLANYTRAAQLHAAIANATVQLHHVLGFVYGDTAPLRPVYNWGYNNPPDFSFSDSFDRLDVDAGLSLTSKSANTADRRGAIQAIAATAAALEGSVSTQIADVPDTSSTATRFEWGNTPPVDAQNPFNIGPQKFYQFDSNTGSAAANLVQVDGAKSGSCPSAGLDMWSAPPTIGSGECNSWKSALSGAILDYTNAGFTVVASQEAFLGPGQRGGAIDPVLQGINPVYYTHDLSKQRGGAFVATQYDSNGDPIQIAHIQVGQSSLADSTIVTKGGGGGVQPNNANTYNPSEAADILKSQFVDRSNLFGVNLANGSLGYTSPAMLRVGNGGFPYELSASMIWHPAPPRTEPNSPTEPQRTWTMSWFNTLGVSSSGLEAMGQSDIRAAAGTVAAFVAAQDIYKTTSPTPERETAAVLANAWWADQIMGNDVTVTVGNDTRQFLRLANGQWILPGTGYATIAETGTRSPYEYLCPAPPSGPPYTYSRGWDYSNVSFTTTNRNGDTQAFSSWTNNYVLDEKGNSCGQMKGFRLTSWTFPYGSPTPVKVTLDYGNPYDPNGSGGGIERLVDVKNSLGRQIDFSYDLDTLIEFDNNFGTLDPNRRAVTLATDRSWMTDPLQTAVGVPAGETTFTYLPIGSTTRPVLYPLLEDVFTADNATHANLEYDYDTLGRVNQVLDAVAIQKMTRGPYLFYLADGTRGERDDPLGQPYSVVYDTYGHPSGYIDELGHETYATIDSRGRVQNYTYPEGNCEAFAYDDHNNTTDYWRVDKTSGCNTGAGSAHVLHASATYHQTWNKPLTVKNARGYTTTLAYYTSGNGKSLLHTATRPAITEGTPIYTFAYTGLGKVDTLTGPTGIVTKNNYDSSGNLTSTIDDYSTGSGHLNLTTAFGYDAQGDVGSTTDPRGIYTNSCYDLDRRKTEDDHHDGGSAATLIAAEQTVYDLVGRDQVDKRASAFASPVPCSGQTASTGITWLTEKTTSYTPTSKVNTVTDADSRVTTNTWDQGDRLIDVSDPLQRKTHYHYCAAGTANCAANAIQTEYRAYSSGLACTKSGTLQQCYRRYTYGPDGEQASIKDANNNTTTYCYDGFVRLNETDFPDSGGILCQTATDYEKLTLDANGNVTQRRTRTGDLLTYQYNELDWMRQKVSPRLPVTTNWTYLLDGRIDTLGDTAGNLLDYGYDTAGRQNGVTTTIPGALSGTPQAVSYALDADGNRTQLTWPDGFYVGYCYDNLNRMTVAMKDSTDPNCNTAKFATYTYNPLSRRTDVTYGFGSKMDYTYSPGGDLLTLNHTIVGTTPQYTFQYTDAHQLWTESVSDMTGHLSYEWEPSAASTDSYAAANQLNQYPSWTPNGGSSAGFGYDLNANLTSGTIGGGAWTFYYDAESRLVTADKTVGGTVHAAYAYDPLGRRTHKSGTGVTETYFLSDGTDEIYEYNGTGLPTRRIVPGPTIDEPIVQGSGTNLGTYRYFHTNHQGSVTGTVGSNGALFEGPYTYDSYGNCYSGASPCQIANGGTYFRFTGRRFDPETGLLYYRARYYSPAIGRFLQTDPVGYSADMNLYTYVGNDPMDKTDPLGLESCPVGQTCPDIPRAPPSVESASVGAAKAMPISEGNHETGAQVMVDKNNADKVTEVRTGAQAGQNDPNNPMAFKFNLIDKSDPNKLGADVHPHPRQGNPDEKDLGRKAKQDAVNARNLYPSKGDYQHMQQTNAPMFNKNDAGAITETFRTNNVDHTIVVSPGDKPLGPVPSDLRGVVTTP